MRRVGRLPMSVQTGTIETQIPARLDRQPWSRFHWLVVIGLGTERNELRADLLATPRRRVEDLRNRGRISAEETRRVV
jgi:hypothetical protein